VSGFAGSNVLKVWSEMEQNKIQVVNV